MFQSIWGCSVVDDLVGQVVGRADPRPAALAGVVEGVLVDLAGHGVVDDVAGGHAVVLALEPGVDPERLGPDDLLLVVGHRARDVHQVEDDGVELGQGDRVPGAVELVLADRDDQRVVGVVGVGGDLPLEGLLVGALEVAEALGAGLADAGVLVLLLDDVGPPLGLDPGQGQPLAEDLRPARPGSARPRGCDARAPRRPPAPASPSPERPIGVPTSPGPLADPAAVLGPVAELGDLDLRQRDRDELAPGLADHLAVGDVFPQVGLDLAPDDLLEPIGVTLDFSHHGCCTLAVGRQSTSARPDGAPTTSRHRRRPAAGPDSDSAAAQPMRSRPRVRPQLRWQRSSRGQSGGNRRRRVRTLRGDLSPAGTTSVQSDPHDPLANSIPGPDAYSSRPRQKAGLRTRGAPPVGQHCPASRRPRRDLLSASCISGCRA